MSCSLLPTGYAWSGAQNNATNAYYTSLPSGSTNNNSKTNAYAPVPFAESINKCDRLLEAEDECYSNKKNRMDANKVHFHLTKILPLVNGLEKGVYTPLTSICFVLEYPVHREVFAAAYEDRIMHHLVAPYIIYVADKAHEANGDVSHGNRTGFSTQTAAEQIQAKMREHPDGWILGMDIQGFFMSVKRRLVLDVFLMFEEMYKPNYQSDEEREWILAIIKFLVMSSPTDNCDRRSPESAWRNIPPHKCLPKDGIHGVPIGNYYVQLLVNLLLAMIDRVMRITHFVDDYCGVYGSLDEVIEARRKFREVTKQYGLTAHPNKLYIQPVRHGVKFCGRVVYKDRMYISNRIVKACNAKIDQYLAISSPTLKDARKLMSSTNSYTGIMCHLQAYNIQKKIVARVEHSQYEPYIRIKEKYNHLIIVLTQTRKSMSEQTYDSLTKTHKQYDKRCTKQGASWYAKNGKSRVRFYRSLLLRTKCGRRICELHREMLVH